MFIPIGDENLRMSTPWVTLGLIAVNMAVFVFTGMWMDPERYYSDVLVPWGFTPSQPGPITIITSVFLHGDIFHLLGNMIFLWVFGRSIEDEFGWQRYLSLYGAGGILASIAYGLMASDGSIPLVGASGAIFSIMGAYLFLMPTTKIRFFYYFYYRPGQALLPAWFAVGLYVLLDLLASATDDGVAHWAHIGGAGAGLGLAWVIRTYWKVPRGLDEPAMASLKGVIKPRDPTARASAGKPAAADDEFARWRSEQGPRTRRPGS